MSTTGPDRETAESPTGADERRRPFGAFLAFPAEAPARRSGNPKSAPRSFSVPARPGPGGDLEAVPWLSPDHLDEGSAPGYLALAALSRIKVRPWPQLGSPRRMIGDGVSVLVGLSFHEAYYLCGALGGRLPTEEEVEIVLKSRRVFLGPEPPAIWTTSLWTPLSPESRSQLAALFGNRQPPASYLRAPSVPDNTPYRTAIEPAFEDSGRRRARIGDAGAEASAGLAAWILFDR